MGCNFDSSNNDNTQSNSDEPTIQLRFATPQSLRSASIIGLRSYATLDGGDPIPLEINTDNTITGTISNVAVGEHELIVIYHTSLNTAEIRLATFTTRVTVIQGQITRVELKEVDLDRNIDDDLDGYTNLAEVGIGTNPLDKSDMPSGESPWFRVANGSFGAAMSDNNLDIKYDLGESINGTAKSTNFQIIIGFNHYQK